MYKPQKRLTQKEEVELCVRMKNGDLKAREILFKSVALWAIKVAIGIARYRYGSNVGQETIDDTIQAGLCGVLEGLKRFDHTRGLRVCTYVTYWVRRECFSAIWDNRTIRIPKGLRNKMSDNPGMKRVFSLDTTEIDKFGEHKSFEHRELYTEDKGFEMVDQDDFFRFIVGEMDKLSDREKDILMSRSKGVTLRKIGEKYGLSRERIRQIQNNALQTLREILKDRV